MNVLVDCFGGGLVPGPDLLEVIIDHDGASEFIDSLGRHLALSVRERLHHQLKSLEKLHDDPLLDHLLVIVCGQCEATALSPRLSFDHERIGVEPLVLVLVHPLAEWRGTKLILP